MKNNTRFKVNTKIRTADVYELREGKYYTVRMLNV